MLLLQSAPLETCQSTNWTSSNPDHKFEIQVVYDTKSPNQGSSCVDPQSSNIRRQVKINREVNKKELIFLTLQTLGLDSKTLAHSIYDDFFLVFENSDLVQAVSDRWNCTAA